MIKHNEYVTLIHQLQNKTAIHLTDISFHGSQDIRCILTSLAEQGAPFFVDREMLILQESKLAELLSLRHIYAELQLLAPNMSVVDLHLSVSLPSTNLYLKELGTVFGDTSLVSVAETQTAGVGRMGRRWISQIGNNIYFSMRKKVNVSIRKLTPFSLVVGLCVVDTLQSLGIDGLKLKWPNDIYFEGKKLSGVLIELVKQDKNFVELIIGIGINLKMDPSFAKAIDQDWTDLYSISRHIEISRNSIVSKLINTLLQSIAKYELHGFYQFKDKWEEKDYLLGKKVYVKGGSVLYSGIASGISADGELLVKSSGTLHKISSGEVSVRLS